jgi:two-component system heavy metal sensor histidine kinase CusS
MRRLPIRLRLAGWYSAIFAAGVALFGAAMWLALKQRLIRDVDAALLERVRGLETVLEVEQPESREQIKVELSEFAREVQNGELTRLSDSRGVLLAPGGAPRLFARSLRLTTPVFFSVEEGGLRFRVFGREFQRRGESYNVLAAAPLTPVYSILHGFLRAMLLMAPLLLAASAAGGYWLSRRALMPVDEITRTARSIHVHNLSQRVPDPGTGDELQRLSEAWNEVLERLDESVERMRRFTADASHELRTPIALIRATAELALRRQRSGEQYRSALMTIKAEAEHMTNLAESLLLAARADSGGADMPLAPADVNLIAAQIVDENQPLALARNIQLRAVTAGHPAIASVNAAGVRRIITILVDNALKYTPAYGDVTVRVSQASSGVEIAVEDSGDGIAPASLPHIFERFYRADPSRTDRAGAGLGLSIAQALARAHGSEIAVQSAPGAGSRFSVFLKS